MEENSVTAEEVEAIHTLIDLGKAFTEINMAILLSIGCKPILKKEMADKAIKAIKTLEAK
jgi:hypothetical protein